MEGSEELREALLSMRRELDFLRTEATHANLLLTALNAVLCVDGTDDPFEGVFSALMEVFACAHAIVLIESEDGAGPLECVASSHQALVGSAWNPSPVFDKVLAGRIVSNLADARAGNDLSVAGFSLSGREPALRLPLAVRGRRGLMILLRQADETGFDRNHVTLAKKFSLLASHAFAAKRASQTEAETQRLKQLTEQLRASQEELRFRANHDQLTGLPNRAYIQELVGGMIARKKPGEKLALAFIDLDDFKRINDLHGHAAGDAMLKEVARRVGAEIRENDVFGRISGDEFVIVLDSIGERADAAVIVERIRERLRGGLQVEGAEVYPSASIGIALYPAHGRDYDSLRRHADMAMYHAKSSAKGSVAFFNRELGRMAEQKLSLEQKLRLAVSKREFRCALQRKVNIRNQETVGFEALVRWVDHRGLVRTPGHFLPLAGELGLLDDIAGMVADDLLSHLAALDKCFGGALRYSVNVSPAQAARADFMIALIRKLADAGCPQRFIIELTEESVAATGPFQTLILPLLRAAGVGISIDDFGTGYSSLATLADLTVDELKIDRSLIASIHQRPRNQSILRAIESLGAALGICVVAEGIESMEEKDYLIRETRLAIGQGYLFHKPQLLSDLLLRAAEDQMPRTG